MDTHRGNSKISIVGAGQVGLAIAYSLLIQSVGDEIILIDSNEDKAYGEAMDLAHGLPFLSPCQVSHGTLKDIKGSQIVIVTAGAKHKFNETRLDLAQRNTHVIREILSVGLPLAHDAIWLIVSNPVDVMTYITLKYSSLPRSQVIGSGTVIDTARLRFLLSKEFKIDPRSIHAYIVGEHGDSEVAVWSQVSIGGELLLPGGIENCPQENQDLYRRIYEEVKNAAYEIIKRKGATSYAIGLGVTQIVQAIIKDQNRILPVSAWVGDQYDLPDVCLSLPMVINRTGASKIIKLNLSPDEMSKLLASAQVIRKSIDSIQKQKTSERLADFI